MYYLTICGVGRIEKRVLLGRGMVHKGNDQSEGQHFGASASSQLLAVGLLLELIHTIIEEQQEACARRRKDKRAGNLKHHECLQLEMKEDLEGLEAANSTRHGTLP